ncbi:MAG: hypothetical protein IKU14_08005 [Rhodocyclaceae bacterium]|nr:hypothetical protein [Rhodocyclaceae bacterium]
MMKKLTNLYTNLGRTAHASATATTTKYLTYMEGRPVRERRLMMASACITFIGLYFVSAAAHAAGEGLAGMFDTAAQQGESIKTSLGKIFTAGGFAGAGYGGYNWWRKGKEGERSQVTGGQVLVPILGGAALGATGFVLARGGETIGINEQ